MTEVKLFSWNVNGIRALVKKYVHKDLMFLDWMAKESPDVLCLQETKAHPDQLSKDLLEIPNYHANWNSAERKGYSGVVTYSKEEPKEVTYDLGKDYLNNEGRMLITEFKNFVLCNGYFPNGKKNDERLQYKLDFYAEFLKLIEKKRSAGKSIIFTGDINTAHQEIDLTHPKGNDKISGFLPIERAWMDKVVETGYIDSFRHLHPGEPKHHTWWSVRSIGAREKNVGWRLDYFFISNDLLSKMTDSYILAEVMGSDHCPIGLKLKF
ncbi:MAG: exodeoxyribonuclease III [Candidatus Heimdallarchaeota archaeon]